MEAERPSLQQLPEDQERYSSAPANILQNLHQLITGENKATQSDFQSFKKAVREPLTKSRARHYLERLIKSFFSKTTETPQPPSEAKITRRQAIQQITTGLIGLKIWLDINPVSLAQESFLQKDLKINELGEDYISRQFPSDEAIFKNIEYTPLREVTLPLLTGAKDDLKAYPAAHDMFEFVKRWRDTVGEEELYKAVALITQQTQGKVLISSGLGETDDPLSELISSLTILSLRDKERFLPSLMTSLTAELNFTKPHLGYLNNFSAAIYMFQHTVSLYEKNRIDDQVFDELTHFYTDMGKNQIRIDAFTFAKLGWFYKNLPEESRVADFPTILSEVKRLIDCTKGFWHSNEFPMSVFPKEIMDFFLRALEKDCSAAQIKNKVDITISFIEKLAQRGEADILDSLDSFERFGTKPTQNNLETLLDLHQSFGIVNIARLQNDKEDFEFINELLKNKDPAYRANDRCAVVLMAREGSNFLFDTFTMGNFLQTLKKLNTQYKVLPFEVASKQGVEETIPKFRLFSQQEKIDLLILAGHGTQYRVNFGHDLGDAYIPPEDRPKGKRFLHHGTVFSDLFATAKDFDFFKKLAPFLNDQAVVVLFSCSTAKGKTETVNVANACAYSLSHRTVIGATDVTVGIDVDEKGPITDSEFLFKKGTAGETYRVRYSP